MLEEAIELIRRLWTGDLVTERTPHYTIDRARLYTIPETSPPIAVAASAPAAARLAGRAGRRLDLDRPGGRARGGVPRSRR